MDEVGQFEEELRSRAGGVCELCKASEQLAACAVPPRATSSERCALICATCRSQILGEAELDSKHWFCLQEAVWSEVVAVQVLSYRLLTRLKEESWAQDLLGQVYLDEETMEWANVVADKGDPDEGVVTLDSNGTPLAEGDSVTLIKDLDVKGGGFVAKRGTMVKNIRLIDDPDNIEGRVNKMTLVLKTKFLKKVG